MADSCLFTKAGGTAKMLMWHNNYDNTYSYMMLKVSPYQEEILHNKKPNRNLSTENQQNLRLLK